MRQLFAGLVLAVTAGLLPAADDKPAAPTGTWIKEAEGMTLQFAFQPKDELLIDLTAGDAGAVLTCKYGQDKDGTVRVEIKKVEVKGDFPGKPSVGEKFGFKWKAKDKTATLSDFTGDQAEHAADIVEGEYKKVAAK